MAQTSETIQREIRLHSDSFLSHVLASDHRKWRGWKLHARVELARRSVARRRG